MAQVRYPTSPRGPGGLSPVHIPGVDQQGEEGGEDDSQQDRQDGNDDQRTCTLGPGGSLECLCCGGGGRGPHVGGGGAEREEI